MTQFGNGISLCRERLDVMLLYVIILLEYLINKL
jgi:hypothetical protein